MAVSTDTYLTLADAKIQLRIDDDGVAGDGGVVTVAVESAIESAVGYVAKITGLPLMSADYTASAEDVAVIERAVIIAAREFFEGASSVAARRALDVIAGPLKRY